MSDLNRFVKLAICLSLLFVLTSCSSDEGADSNNDKVEDIISDVMSDADGEDISDIDLQDTIDAMEDIQLEDAQVAVNDISSGDDTVDNSEPPFEEVAGGWRINAPIDSANSCDDLCQQQGWTCWDTKTYVPPIGIGGAMVTYGVAMQVKSCDFVAELFDAGGRPLTELDCYCQE